MYALFAGTRGDAVVPPVLSLRVTAIYGTLELVPTRARRKVLERTRDATGRYCGVRAGKNLEVVDLAAPELPVVATFALPKDRTERARVGPDGRRIVVRHGAMLELHDETRTLASIETPTIAIDWQGRRVDPLAPARDLADEHFGLTHDGKYVWLAAHDSSGRPSIMLFDEALALLDTFDDLRSYSPYSKAPYEPLARWSGSWLAPQPHAPGFIVGGVNYGDSCAAVLAFSVEKGRLSVEQELISKSVFGVDGYFLRDLRVTPQGELLVLTMDALFAALPWPPSTAASSAEPRIARAHPTKWLFSARRREIVLPFRHPPNLTVIGCVDATADHVLCGIESEDGRTVALVALHPRSIEPLGLVRTPYAMLHLLGRDLFSHAGSFFRLQR